MNRQSAFAVACAVSATAALGVVASPAGAISLGDLVTPTNTPLSYESNGQTFMDGDLLFSNFTFQVAVACPPSATSACIPPEPGANVRPLDPGLITIGPATTKHGFGLQFNDFWTANPEYGIDIALTYDVEVKEDGPLLNDIHLRFDAVIDQGFVEILETVFDDETDMFLGQLVADNRTETADVPNLIDEAIFTKSVKKANVVKNIQLIGGGSNDQYPGRARFTSLDQEFSRDVPEPGTVTGLLAIGSLSVGAMLKRHFGKKA